MICEKCGAEMRYFTNIEGVTIHHCDDCCAKRIGEGHYCEYIKEEPKPKYWCKKRQDYVDEETYISEDCMGVKDPNGRCPQLVIEEDPAGTVKAIPVKFRILRIIKDT